jgi:hypothetical protein
VCLKRGQKIFKRVVAAVVLTVGGGRFAVYKFFNPPVQLKPFGRLWPWKGRNTSGDPHRSVVHDATVRARGREVAAVGATTGSGAYSDRIATDASNPTRRGFDHRYDLGAVTVW